MWGLTGVGPPASATAQAAVLAGAQNLAGYQGMNGGMMFHPGNTTHRGDGPSTPTSHPAGLATTPGPSHGGMMTPGASGTFGEFRYGGK